MKNIIMIGMVAGLMAGLLAGCRDGSESKIEKESNPVSPQENIPENTISICVVVDASGSMGYKVANLQNNLEEKYLIADRSLVLVGRRLDSHLSAFTNRTIKVSIVVLRNGKSIISKTGLIKKDATEFFSSWVSDYELIGPAGGTPLGESIEKGAEELIPLKLKNNHIIILSDGESNLGKRPEVVIKKLNERFVKSGSSLNTYFIAFDVDSEVFRNVKLLGASVVGASNERELNEKLNRILTEDVLLEREE